MRYYLRELIAEKMRNTGQETSLEHISESTGLSINLLKKIHANTERYTSLRTLEKLADYFDCDLGDLVKLRLETDDIDRGKLDAITDIVTEIRTDLRSLMHSYQAPLEGEQYSAANASESSLGNALQEAIGELLSEPTLNGIRDRLAAKSRESPLPVRRIPFRFLMPLQLHGDEVIDRWLGRRVSDIDEAREILHDFLAARDNAREAICRNLTSILTSTEKPDSYEKLVLVTAGYSSVVEKILGYLRTRHIEPTILISLGAEGIATQYEGILMWRRLKSIGYEKAYVIGPYEYTRNAFKETICRFLNEFIAQGSNGYDIGALFGFEGVRCDGLSVITSKEFEIALAALRSLRDSRDITLNLRTYFVGEAYKIMNPGDDICFKMDERYICPIPCKEIDYLVTEHEAHKEKSMGRFEIDCCKEVWREMLRTV